MDSDDHSCTIVRPRTKHEEPETSMILKALAHIVRDLREQKESRERFQKEVLQRIESLEEDFRLLLSTPDKEAKRLFLENERVRAFKS